VSEELRCTARQHCRNATDGHGAVTQYPNTLCDVCVKYYGNAVHQLPQHWENLRNALGERPASEGEYVKSSPVPAIPISTGREGLMVAIRELADRAAGAVADMIGARPPSGRRPSPRLIVDGKETVPLAGTPAYNAENTTAPTDLETIQAAVAMVEPHLDKLALAPAREVTVWLQPSRCDAHYELIHHWETQLAEAKDRSHRDTYQNSLKQAWHAASQCNDCCGWSPDGKAQATETRAITGLQTLADIADLHNRIRADLGKTRLRHRYAMPCPLCGGRIGRDDGTAIVDCTDCDASWTEREYKLLAGMAIDEKNTVDTLRWLLADAYRRLDALRDGAEKIRTSPEVDQAGAGSYIIEGIDIILDGHLTPDERRIATDKASALDRQLGDDQWTFRNETTYKPPKRKPRKAIREDVPKYTKSSTSTLVEDPTYLPDATDRQSPVCKRCNIIHPPTEDCIA
jgi:hypothetical protein